MSSTNRGKKGGGGSEFFPTPRWAVDALMLSGPDLPGGRWLEPSAGDGAIISAVNAHRSDVQWTAAELREECRADLTATGASVFIGPFQRVAGAFARVPRFDVSILNPPFSQAIPIIQLCLALSNWVVCLERTPWVGDSEDCYDLFHDNMPDAYRIGRCSFTKDRRGDSVPYSWFVWPPPIARGRTEGRYKLLPRPSATARRADREGPAPRQPSLFGGT